MSENNDEELARIVIGAKDYDKVTSFKNYYVTLKGEELIIYGLKNAEKFRVTLYSNQSGRSLMQMQKMFYMYAKKRFGVPIEVSILDHILLTSIREDNKILWEMLNHEYGKELATSKFNERRR